MISYELWGMCINMKCRFIMIVYELWGMCKNVMCKYENTQLLLTSTISINLL